MARLLCPCHVALLGVGLALLASLPCQAARVIPKSAPPLSVLSFGAKGDGKTDDWAALNRAFAAACAGQAGTVLLFPAGYTFVAAKNLAWNGPCTATPLTLQLDGTVLFKTFGNIQVGSFLALWGLSGFSQLTVKGKGVIDGNGATWWQTTSRPHMLVVSNSQGVTVTGITSKNPPKMHFYFQYCNHVVVQGVTTSAPSNSPNTDSVHIMASTDVLLTQSTLSSGDDCVSIVGDSQGVVVKGVTCLSGHGYSIGSLGYGGDTVCLNNITVVDSVLQDTTNGLRIKSYQGGQGLVSNVLFTNIQMTRVQRPIIDQFYCDKTPCSFGSGAPALFNIQYQGITGTTVDKYNVPQGAGITIACSTDVPCSNFMLNTITITPASGGPALVPKATSAYGKINALSSPAGLQFAGVIPSGSAGSAISAEAAKCGVKGLTYRK